MLDFVSIRRRSFARFRPKDRLGLIALAAAALALWLSFRTPEPSYQGTSLSAWFEQLYDAGQSVGPAQDAIRHIGPPAAPFLLDKVRNDNQRWRQWYRDTWRNLPRAAQRVTPRPRLRDESLSLRVKWALRLIGSSGLPHYIAALDDKDPRVRSIALDVIGAAGSDARSATAAVCRVATDSNLELSARALAVLAQIGANTPEVVAILISRLHCQAPGQAPAEPLRPGRMSPAALASNVREQAARTLGRLGPAARAAGPPLRLLLQDPFPQPRTEAAIALWRVANDTNGLPVLLAELERRPHPMECRRLLRGLAELGPAAQPAIPVIARFLAEKSSTPPASDSPATGSQSDTRDFDEILTRDARYALAQIDPNAAHPGTRE